jgi:hypothetical protein
MSTLVWSADFGRLRTRTAYPNIPSYHPPDPDTGALGGALPRPPGDVIATELIAGVSARLAILGDGSYLIGGPQRWLYAAGDRIGDAAFGVTAAVRPHAARLSGSVRVGEGTALVVYGQVFGGKTVTAGRYTSKREVGYRTTDVARVNLAADAALAFLNEAELTAFAAEHELPLVPRVARFPARDLPAKPHAVLTLMEELLPSSRCRLDAGAEGDPEGLVVRTPDRGWVASLRFADYRRVKRRRRI